MDSLPTVNCSVKFPNVDARRFPEDPFTLLNDSVPLLLIKLPRAGRSYGLQGKGALFAKQVPVGPSGPYHQPRQENQKPHGGGVQNALPGITLVSLCVSICVFLAVTECEFASGMLDFL